MQRHNNYSTSIALIVNVHDEGLLLVPALRSALAAAEECRANGISCGVTVLGCETNVATRKIVASYQENFNLISYTELGSGVGFHGHAITHVNAEFYCFLNGADIIQREWPLMAYRHAMQSNYMNCIFHTELLAGFGNTSFVRTQLKSNDPIFHPLHSLISQHYFENMFCHFSILERAPELVRQAAAPHAFETWHWSCETLALGIGRDTVEGTVHFSRQDERLDTPRSLCKAITRPAALLRDTVAVESYGTFSGLSDDSKAAQLSLKNRVRYQDEFPTWLVRAAKQAAAFDSDVFELLKASQSILCETPGSSAGASFLLARAAQFCRESYTVVAVDCEAMSADDVSTLELGLRQARQKNRVMVLCGDVLTHAKLVREEIGICYLNAKMVVRACDGHAFLHRTLAAILANFAPRAFVNINFDLADEFCGMLSQVLAKAQVPTVRYLLSALEDVHTGYNDRRVLAALNQNRFAYTHLAVTNYDNFRYVKSLYAAGGTEILLIPARLSRIGALVEHMSKHVGTAGASASKQPAVAHSLPAASEIDVSCVLNLHREGNILIPTFRSIERMLNFAQRQGISCELVIVLDRPDEHSRRLADKARSDTLVSITTTVVEVDNGDLGCSRRNGVATARGKYIAFLDGDDLYSENWVAEAFMLAQSEGSETATVYHPELNVYFGEHYRTFWHPDAQGLDKDVKTGLLLENFWTSLSFGHRSVYVNNPVHDNGLQQGFGYEDWQWNMHTTAQGIEHRPVPRTLHFIRLKPAGSLNSSSSRRSVIVRPSQLAKTLLFQTACKEQKALARTPIAG